MTKIRIGQEIKQEVQKQDLTIEDFAKNLHLALIPQHYYKYNFLST